MNTVVLDSCTTCMSCERKISVTDYKINLLYYHFNLIRYNLICGDLWIDCIIFSDAKN